MAAILHLPTGAPCVSVLVPCYNVERYVAQCLDSIIGQTLQNIEIICINDGSTDGTRDILGSYAARDGRIRIIDKPNTGYGHSMNQGLDAARGKYIGIVEPDDFVSFEMFESMYKRARRHRLDVVKSNYFNHIDGQDTFYEAFSGFPYDQVFNCVHYPRIMVTYPSIWAGIYRRDMLFKNGIRFLETPGASYQDAGFILKVWFCAKRTMLVQDAFVHYRCDNPDSSMKSGDKVFAVRDELHDAASFMRKHSRMRLRKFERHFERRLIDCYLWNYNRLDSEKRLVFVEATRDEVKRVYRHFRKDHTSVIDVLWEQFACWANDEPHVFLEKYPD